MENSDNKKAAYHKRTSYLNKIKFLFCMSLASLSVLMACSTDDVNDETEAVSFKATYSDSPCDKESPSDAYNKAKADLAEVYADFQNNPTFENCLRYKTAASNYNAVLKTISDCTRSSHGNNTYLELSREAIEILNCE